MATHFLAVVEWESEETHDDNKKRCSSTIMRRCKMRFPSGTSISQVRDQVLQKSVHNSNNYNDEETTTAVVSSSSSSSSSIRHFYEVCVYDPEFGDYRSLEDLKDDETTQEQQQDLAKMYGTRVRLEVRRREADLVPSNDPLSNGTNFSNPGCCVLAIQGRLFDEDFSFVSVTGANDCGGCEERGVFRFAVPNTSKNNAISDANYSSLSSSSSSSSSVLVLEESHNQPNTTAFTIWDGSVLLAKYLVQEVTRTTNAPTTASRDHDPVLLVADRVVLELGAGCGLCGLTAASLGARKVVLTDLSHALPVEQVERNQSVWQPHCKVVECHALDWTQVKKEAEAEEKGAPSSFLLSNPHKYPALDFVDRETTLVLVADCVWTMDLLSPLFDTLAGIIRILHATTTTAQSSSSSSPSPRQELTFLISYQQRGAVTHRAFQDRLQQLFGRIRLIPVEDYGIPTNPVFFLYECQP